MFCQKTYARDLVDEAIARRDLARYGIYFIQPLPVHRPGFDAEQFVKDVAEHLPGSIQVSVFCLSGRSGSDIAFSNHWLPR